jgi:hypothetical protein
MGGNMTSLEFAVISAALYGLLIILAFAVFHLSKKLLLLLIDFVDAPLKPDQEFRILDQSKTPVTDALHTVQTGGTLNRKAL